MDLRTIGELAYRQLFPNPGDETALEVEDFIETAKALYAAEIMLQIWRERREGGTWLLPSYLVKQADIGINDDVADLKDLKILKALPDEIWLVNIGGLTCKCKYVKSTLYQTELLCGDDSMPDDTKTYFVVGTRIHFPRGTHAKTLPIIYADNGSSIDESIEVEEGIAGLVRVRLTELYTGKTGKEDTTNNSNSNQ